VAHREEDLGSESKTINAVVNALAEQAAHASASEESVSAILVLWINPTDKSDIGSISSFVKDPEESQASCAKIII